MAAVSPWNDKHNSYLDGLTNLLLVFAKYITPSKWDYNEGNLLAQYPRSILHDNGCGYDSTNLTWLDILVKRSWECWQEVVLQGGPTKNLQHTATVQQMQSGASQRHQQSSKQLPPYPEEEDMYFRGKKGKSWISYINKIYWCPDVLHCMQ